MTIGWAVSGLSCSPGAEPEKLKYLSIQKIVNSERVMVFYTLISLFCFQKAVLGTALLLNEIFLCTKIFL